MAQSGEKWSFGLNSPSGNAAFGTSNYFPIIIKTNSTEKMRITESGNVGIGTIAPADKLHVAGTARMLNAEVENQLNALNVTAQNANFAVALVTGQLSAGSLTVNGNATISGNLSALGGLTTDNITSFSGNIDFGNNNLNTTGNINSANISALQTTDSILNSQFSILNSQDSLHNSQFSILNSQVDSIQQSQWTTTQNGIEHNGNVFVKTLSVEESINIGSFRFSNGSKDTAIAPPPVIKDTIASDKPIVISAEKNISLSADTVLLGNGTGKVGIGIPPAPGEKLSVAGNVGVSGNLRLSNLSGTDERLLYVDSSGNLKVNPLTAGDYWVTDGNAITNGDFIGTTNATDFNIRTNNVQRMTVTEDGNIHINEHDIYFRSVVPDGNHGLGWYGTDVNFNQNKLFAATDVNGPVLYGWNGGALGVKQGTNENILLRWNENGNVGIGTTTPKERFQIGSIFTFHDGGIKRIGRNVYYDGQVDRRVQSGEASAISFDAQGNIILSTAPIGPTNGPITSTSGWKDAIFIKNATPAGLVRVGVGTNNPQAELDVSGNFRISSTQNTSQYISMDNGSIDKYGQGNLLINYNSLQDITVGNPFQPTNLNFYIAGDIAARGNATFRGKVVIGSQSIPFPYTHSDYQLSVDGKIVSKSSYVTISNWPDSVYSNGYVSEPLEEVENHYKTYKRLKGYPSEKEIIENGLDMGAISTLHQKSIEEIIIYLVEMKKELKQLKEENAVLKKQMETMQIK